MKKLLPGLILVISISLGAMFLNDNIFSFIETLTIGILMGMLYANTIGVRDRFMGGITFALKRMLKWGIVLMGLKLNFSLLVSLGPKILTIIVVLISFALFASYWLGKRRGLSPKLAILLGVGSSICGASAIVAMGPVIGAEEDDITISVTVISLLGAIGVIIYSTLSQVLPITDLQYGVWAGSSLQGVAHALAAAGARGADSLSMDIGTIVKMSRVALLGPVAILLGYVFKKDNESKTNTVKFPRYVLYFILVGIVYTLNSNFNLFPTAFTVASLSIDILAILKQAGSLFILMAMVAMGLKVNLKSFEHKAIRALTTTAILFLCLSLLSILMTMSI